MNMIEMLEYALKYINELKQTTDIIAVAVVIIGVIGFILWTLTYTKLIQIKKNQEEIKKLLGEQKKYF